MAMIVSKFPINPTIPHMIAQTPTAILKVIYSDGKHCAGKFACWLKQKSLKYLCKLKVWSGSIDWKKIEVQFLDTSMKCMCEICMWKKLQIQVLDSSVKYTLKMQVEN